ncbi:acyl-CoA dehydrogenase family protein [Kinneretia aquatilis]|uniref:acyl-CoA dehydrogenase family protein n=1 Tax=Kinneretia aquatilis TaxID=2070761 RepID=UPI0014952E2A|nr:acyl-CoA dehydrogenase family protein [Paucibacter aquatile]WIW00029.1 acyl-CoA dehydrogenase family protein [Paucibacter aquatile]
MQFALTPAQHALQARIATLASSLQDPLLHERDRACEFSRPLWQAMASAGLHLLPAPTEYGGQALGALDLALALETLGEQVADTGLVFALAAHLCACIHPLLTFGSESQQKEWLPQIGKQGWLGAHAITEAQAGSDISAMRTRAQREGQGYRISGRKCYISNAPVCDFLIVHARTGESGSFLDYSSFVLDRHSSGVHISATPHEKLGLRTTAMGDVEFDGVWVHESQRLGKEGSGGPIFQASMAWERSCLFAMYLGTMKRQLRACWSHVEEREQFGRPLIEQQSLAHRLADMQLRYESARLLCLRAAWSLDLPQPARGDASLAAKLALSEAAVLNGLDAVHLHGALGMLSGAIERELRNALPSSVFSGGSEVLKNQLVQQLRGDYKREARGGR